MKKTILFASMLYLTSALTFADETPQAQANVSDFQKIENNIRFSIRPPILGLWGMEIPSNKQCVEYYNFRSDNEVVVKSDKEWSVGMFEYQPPQDVAVDLLPTLVVQVNYDNNERDCSGEKVDQSGEISQYFVKWDNPNQINFCESEKGGQCYAKLHRVLP